MADREATTATFRQGLEDIVAATSSICLIDGVQGGLLYRGHSIDDLAEHSTFEETAYLLLDGALPSRSQPDAFSSQLVENRGVPDYVYSMLRTTPKSAHAMSVLRKMSRELGERTGNPRWCEMSARIEKSMKEEKRLSPTQTSIRHPSTICSESQWNYLLQFLPSAASQAGQHTFSNNTHTTA